MRYLLRYRQREFELTEGRFLIGRSAACQLSVDDALVSRRHALLTVTENGVTVEDLGSRNGVRVNGKLIDGVQGLANGDRVSVGNQELTLLRDRADAADTATRPPTIREDNFALLAGLADKAIALGRGAEAERLLGPRLTRMLEQAEEGGTVDEAAAERAAYYAARLAEVTKRGVWLDYVCHLYSALGRPCSARVVDHLYEVVRQVDEIDLAALRAYVAVLRVAAGELGPAERFLVSRIEGLERIAAAR